MITNKINTLCTVQKDVSVNNESSNHKTANVLDVHPDHDSAVVVTQEHETHHSFDLQQIKSRLNKAVNDHTVKSNINSQFFVHHRSGLMQEHEPH